MMNQMMKIILFVLSLRIRYNQAHIVTAFFLGLFVMMASCDGNETFRDSEQTKQEQRLKGFGYRAPVEVPNLFPVGKVVLK